MWKYLNFTIEMKMNEPIVRIRELKSPFLVKNYKFTACILPVGQNFICQISTRRDKILILF